MDRPFAAENTKERNRLISLVGRLTDQELRLPLGNDWTIAVALAHLSFWDQRALFLMRKWRKSGVVEPAPIDVDLTNDSLLALWSALPPRSAADLAVSSAEQIDRELEEAPSDLITKIERLGENSRLYRSIHRKMHVDEIEKRIGVTHLNC
jgi:DinB superfamily